MMATEIPLPADEAEIRHLLRGCDLPEEDITPGQLRHFLVLKEKGELIGVVGVEVFGRFGLLRSLAVDARYRRRGLASQLVKRAEEYAASLKIETLYLLTLTAESFFSKRSYQKVQRNSVPPPVQGTAEFRHLCPVSAVCMVKHLQSTRAAS